MLSSPATAKGKAIEKLLNWRDPISHIRLEAHIDKEVRRLQTYLEQKPHLRQGYEQWSGEIATSIPPHAVEASALIRRWRAESNLDEIDISQRDLTIISDAGEFVMMPFMRFSRRYRDAVGALANHQGEPDTGVDYASSFGDGQSSIFSSAEHFSERARVRNNEYHALGSLFFELCDIEHYSISPNLRRELENHTPRR